MLTKFHSVQPPYNPRPLSSSFSSFKTHLLLQTFFKLIPLKMNIAGDIEELLKLRLRSCELQYLTIFLKLPLNVLTLRKINSISQAPSKKSSYGSGWDLNISPELFILKNFKLRVVYGVNIHKIFTQVLPHFYCLQLFLSLSLSYMCMLYYICICLFF